MTSRLRFDPLDGAPEQDEITDRTIGENLPDIDIYILGHRRTAELRDFIEVLASQHSDGSAIRHFENSSTANGNLLHQSRNSAFDSDLPEIMLNWDPANRPRSDYRRHRNGRVDSDPSTWFNYGFTEETFKDWIRWQLTMRRDKLRELQSQPTPPSNSTEE